MQPAKVLIVDDHALFRQGVHDALEREEDLSVVGEAENGLDALAKARELNPDLILMDINMPGYGGQDAVRAIKRELPGIKVIMLSVHDDDESLFEAIKGGADGFLTKNVRVDALIGSVRSVAKGEAVLSGKMIGTILREYARLARMEASDLVAPLTPRERQVLDEIRQGSTNKDIANSLYISEYTVKAHVTSILRNLHLQNRYQAAAYARRMGFREGVDMNPRS